MAKKKALLGVVCLVMVALIAVFGTVAYLTDRDAETNVFTSGDVSIDLQETFTQNSQLLPGVEVNKDVTIKNDGKNDAWVWYTYAIPVEADKVLDVAVSEDTEWFTPYGSPVVQNVEIENGETVECNVYTRFYNDDLDVNETTPVDLTSVVLASDVDVVDGKYYQVENGTATLVDYNFDNTKIFVTAYAIQEENFTDVYAAYAAFSEQWGLDNALIELPDADVTLLSDENGSITNYFGNLVQDGVSYGMAFTDINEVMPYALQFSVIDAPVNDLYKTWNADFVLVFDKNVPAGDKLVDNGVVYNSNIILAGQYDFAGNHAYPCPIEGDIVAGEPIRVMEQFDNVMSGFYPLSFEFIMALVEDFRCGVIFDPYNVGAVPDGTTVTVQLVMYETEYDEVSGEYVETDRSFVVEEKAYTYHE